MKKIVDLLKYNKEHGRYKNITRNLFWYKKHKKLKWVKGQNFGDYLSTIIVGKVAEHFKITNYKQEAGHNNKRLFAVGSILHFARDNDVVWGSGVNGKIQGNRYHFANLDVRMVRGPKTKAFLEEKGISVPNIYGDPVLLLPFLFPSLKWNPKKGKIIVIPNLNELLDVKNKIPSEMKYVSPLMHWRRVVDEILSSELVITSSLHGIIVAEVFGVPVRFVKPFGGETLFKYQDYIEGTGRISLNPTETLSKNISKTSGVKISPLERIPIELILNAFPIDLFK